MTSTQLAEKTGLSERYMREWLGAMTSAGYVNYDPAAKTYTMPPEHAMVLARDDSPFFAGGFIEMIVPQMSIAPKVLESFQERRAAFRRASIRPRRGKRWSARRPGCTGIR